MSLYCNLNYIFTWQLIYFKQYKNRIQKKPPLSVEAFCASSWAQINDPLKYLLNYNFTDKASNSNKINSFIQC